MRIAPTLRKNWYRPKSFNCSTPRCPNRAEPSYRECPSCQALVPVSDRYNDGSARDADDSEDAFALLLETR